MAPVSALEGRAHMDDLASFLTANWTNPRTLQMGVKLRF
jgi:hypothetical protein